MVAKHAVIFLRIFMYVYVCKYVYTHIHIYMYIYIFKDFICLLWEWGREGEREWEKQQHSRDTSSGCLSHALNWGLDLNPGMCPDQEGIQPATFWFTGQHSIHWATPARAYACVYIYIYIYICIYTYIMHLLFCGPIKLFSGSNFHTRYHQVSANPAL